jgi:hypothetical protein
MFNKLVFIASLGFILSCSKDDDPAIFAGIDEEFVGEIDLIKTLGGSQQDDFLSVVTTTNGGVAAFGFTQSNDGDVIGKPSTDSDYWLVKFDQDLNIQWQKIFGGSDDDRGQSIIQTDDGGFAVTGFSRSDDGDITGNFGFQDYWVVKLDALGGIQWEKSIGFSGNDRGYDIIQTQDGGYFATGFLDVTASEGEGNDDFDNLKTSSNSKGAKHGVGEYWGIKLNAGGDIQWRRYFGGTNNDRSYAAIQTQDGGYIQTGHSESDDFDVENPIGSYDIWVVKTFADGVLDWEKSFGGSGIEIAFDVIETEDNNFMLVGDTRSSDRDVSNPRGNADIWIIKFDVEGNLIWEKTYGGPEFESGRSIIAIGNNDYFITSSSRSSTDQVETNYGSNDVWGVIIDGNGDIKWQKTIGGSGLDFGNDAAINSSKEIFVVGSTASNDFNFPTNKGDNDAFIIKLK